MNDNVVLTPEEEQLTNELYRGNQAKRAYEEFIKGFVEEKRLVLFNTFSSLPLTAETELMEVKRMLYAVDTLEAEILTVIETGKFASITLDKEVKH